jgi:hypothetical protein
VEAPFHALLIVFLYWMLSFSGSKPVISVCPYFKSTAGPRGGGGARPTSRSVRGTQKFITVYTTASHLSQTACIRIQCISLKTISFTFIFALFCHLILVSQAGIYLMFFSRTFHINYTSLSHANKEQTPLKINCYVEFHVFTVHEQWQLRGCENI